MKINANILLFPPNFRKALLWALATAVSTVVCIWIPLAINFTPATAISLVLESPLKLAGAVAAPVIVMLGAWHHRIRNFKKANINQSKKDSSKGTTFD